MKVFGQRRGGIMERGKNKISKVELVQVYRDRKISSVAMVSRHSRSSCTSVLDGVYFEP